MNENVTNTYIGKFHLDATGITIYKSKNKFNRTYKLRKLKTAILQCRNIIENKLYLAGYINVIVHLVYLYYVHIKSVNLKLMAYQDRPDILFLNFVDE